MSMLHMSKVIPSMNYSFWDVQVTQNASTFYIEVYFNKPNIGCSGFVPKVHLNPNFFGALNFNQISLYLDQKVSGKS